MFRRISSKQPEVIMSDKKGQPVHWEAVLTGVFRGKTVMEFGTNRSHAIHAILTK